MPAPSGLNVNSISISTGYLPDVAKNIIIDWDDYSPIYQSIDINTWLYGITFFLWSASSSGTRTVSQE